MAERRDFYGLCAFAAVSSPIPWVSVIICIVNAPSFLLMDSANLI